MVKDDSKFTFSLSLMRRSYREFLDGKVQVASNAFLNGKECVLNACRNTVRCSGRRTQPLHGTYLKFCLSRLQILSGRIAIRARGSPLGGTLGYATALRLRRGRGAFSFATATVHCARGRSVTCD